MNARSVTFRVLSGLLVAISFFILPGCATRGDVMYIPSESRYATQGLSPISPSGVVVTRGPTGCIATRYDTAVPSSVAVPCVARTDSSTLFQSGLHERSRYERSVLDGLLVQAHQQLQEVCTPVTVNARLAAEALVTGVTAGAIARSNRAAATGASVGALSGFGRGGRHCQEAVDWHHRLLLELSKELRYQREVVGPKCQNAERGGRQSRECSETTYGSWRR